MIRETFALFGQTLRDGLRIWWLAPLIPALVVAPEFIQHIAEIRIGMFESKEAFRLLADDPRRMVWGFLKIAGLLLAILAAVRFWGAAEQGQKWWNLRGIHWKALGIAAVLMALTSVPEWLLTGRVSEQAALAVTAVITLATLPLIVYLVRALAGGEPLPLKTAFTRGWWPSLRILLFAAATWMPLQWLHGQTHVWAMGQPDALVWALMAFDALLVGLLATMAGTAFHHGATIKTTAAPA